MHQLSWLEGYVILKSVLINRDGPNPTIETTLENLDDALIQIASFQDMLEIFQAMNLGNDEADLVAKKIHPRLHAVKAKLLTDDVLFKSLEKLRTVHVRDLEVCATIDSFMNQMRANGVGLPESAKASILDLQTQTSGLLDKFSNHTENDITANPFRFNKPDWLAGVNRNLVREFRQGKSNAFSIPLRGEIVRKVLAEASNAKFRERLWRAWVHVAASGEFGNALVAEKIAGLRSQLAEIADPGHSFAEMRAKQKWFGSLSRIESFVEDLATLYAPLENHEFETLARFATTDRVAPWDSRFYQRKLREQIQGLADEELKKFFPLDQVTNQVLATAAEVFLTSAAFREQMYSTMLSRFLRRLSKPSAARPTFTASFATSTPVSRWTNL